MMKRKVISRPFTLMEVSIAFSLVGIIVGLLMNSMRNSIVLAEEMGGVRKIVLERHKCYARLSQVFSQARGESFKLEGKTLLFTFENGVDPEMEFSGEVKGKVYIDKNKNFILTITSKKGSKERHEYLFPWVEGVEYEKINEDVLLLTLLDRDEKEVIFPCFLTKLSKAL